MVAVFSPIRFVIEIILKPFINYKRDEDHLRHRYVESNDSEPDRRS